PQCRVIFLTGYDEFEYAYKAIRHKAVNYILKIEDNEKVIKAVSDAVEDIQQERRIKNLANRAADHMRMTIEQFRSDYFISLLNGDGLLNIDQSKFDQLKIPLH